MSTSDSYTDSAEGITLPSDGKQSFCEAYVEGKMHRLSYIHSSEMHQVN